MNGFHSRDVFFLRRGIFLGGYGLKYKERGFPLEQDNDRELGRKQAHDNFCSLGNHFVYYRQCSQKWLKRRWIDSLALFRKSMLTIVYDSVL